MTDFVRKILDIKAFYIEKGFDDPLLLKIHPGELTQLIKDIRFTDIPRYSTKTPVYSGEVGSIFGVKIIVDPNLPQGKAIVTRINQFSIQKKIHELGFNPSRRIQENIEFNF